VIKLRIKMNYNLEKMEYISLKIRTLFELAKHAFRERAERWRQRAGEERPAGGVGEDGERHAERRPVDAPRDPHALWHRRRPRPWQRLQGHHLPPQRRPRMHQVI